MNKKRTVVSVVVGIIFLVVIFTFYTTFSLGAEYHFASEVYSIEDGYIYGISPYTEVGLFYDYFDLENCSIEVVDQNNYDVVSGYVGNGSRTILYDENHQVISSYFNVVKGDIDSNGMVNEEDFSLIGEYLVKEKFGVEDIPSFDVDLDQEIHINDLVLLDQVVHGDYQEIHLSKDSVVLQTNEKVRIVGSVQPDYGKNFNLKWSSSNEDIVTVQSSGILQGHLEGEATVRAETMDGKLFQEVSVVVDNTIQLAGSSGIIYVGGSEKSVFIKSIDYEGITCNSSNESAVHCRIDHDKLMLQGIQDGSSTVTVSSPFYGSVEYQVQAYSTYINLFPSYGCSPVNRTGSVIISSFYAGEITFQIVDTDIIKNAYISQNRFFVTSGDKAGRGEVIVKESNGNSEKSFILDVYRLTIPAIGGFGKVGEEMVTDIVAEGTEMLSCTSPDESIATCRVEENKLYVMPLKVGQVEIKVENTIYYNGTSNACGSTTFLAVIRE